MIESAEFFRLRRHELHRSVVQIKILPRERSGGIFRIEGIIDKLHIPHHLLQLGYDAACIRTFESGRINGCKVQQVKPVCKKKMIRLAEVICDGICLECCDSFNREIDKCEK